MMRGIATRARRPVPAERAGVEAAYIGGCVAYLHLIGTFAASLRAAQRLGCHLGGLEQLGKLEIPYGAELVLVGFAEQVGRQLTSGMSWRGSSLGRLIHRLQQRM